MRCRLPLRGGRCRTEWQSPVRSWLRIATCYRECSFSWLNFLKRLIFGFSLPGCPVIRACYVLGAGFRASSCELSGYPCATAGLLMDGIVGRSGEQFPDIMKKAARGRLFYYQRSGYACALAAAVSFCRRRRRKTLMVAGVRLALTSS